MTTVGTLHHINSKGIVIRPKSIIVLKNNSKGCEYNVAAYIRFIRPFGGNFRRKNREDEHN